MIIGIGCDIVDHGTTEKLNWHSDLKIQSRIFSLSELEIAPTHSKQQISFLAGRFAVKEAVLKCLGIGIIDGICLNEIETLKDDQLRPIIVLRGEVQRIALKKGVTNWHITLSHSEANSIAFVIAEKNG